MPKRPQTHTIQPYAPGKPTQRVTRTSSSKREPFTPTTAMIEWAKYGPNIIHITSTRKIDNMPYTCLSCDHPLIARRGKKRSAHFSHTPNQPTICDAHSTNTKSNRRHRIEAINNLFQTLTYVVIEDSIAPSVSLSEICTARHQNRGKRIEFKILLAGRKIRPSVLNGEWSVLVLNNSDKIEARLQIGGRLSKRDLHDYPSFLISVQDARSWDGKAPLPVQLETPTTCYDCQILDLITDGVYHTRSTQDSTPDPTSTNVVLDSIVILWEGTLTVDLSDNEPHHSLRVIIGDELDAQDVPQRRVLAIFDRLIGDTANMKELLTGEASLSEVRARFSHALNTIISSMKRNSIHPLNQVKFLSQIADDEKDAHLLRLLKATLLVATTAPSCDKRESEKINKIVNALDCLKINKSGDLRNLKDLFRKLSKIYHPDREGGSHELMKSLNEARSVLQEHLPFIESVISFVTPLINGRGEPR